MNYQIKEVVSFPAVIEPGILYWSKEFEMSAHKCACGCGDVIQLPIDSQNFRITGTSSHPTLRPSVGNWGVCDAHYYITSGQVQWLPKMSTSQIAAGRKFEDDRRQEHYASLQPTFSMRAKAFVAKIWKSIWS